MGLSPKNAALVERIFGKPVMLDEEGEDWNALLDAARSEATEAQARRIGELEEGLRSAARNLAVCADVIGTRFKDNRHTLVEGWAERARVLLIHDTKEPSDDR